MKKTIAICFFCVAFFFFVPDLSANSDLRPLFSTYLLEPKDQGARPTCSPSAIATLLEFEYNKHAINHPIILSIEYLNWAANEVTGTNQDGSLFTTLIKGLEVKGVCQETKMPYQASFDPAITPSSEALNDAETRRQYYITWIKNLNAYTGMTQYQIDEIKKLLNIGYPVAIGSGWPTNPIFDSNHVLSEIPSENEVFDGHSVVIVGYFDDNDYPGCGVFIIRNSSGSSWQDNGHAKIPYEYYKLYGNDALALDVKDTHLPPDLPFIQTNKLIEFEDLTILETNAYYTIQDMSGFNGGLWSNDKQIFFGSLSTNDYIEFNLYSTEAKNYDINLYLTKAPDFGIFDFTINGNNVLEKFDAFSRVVQPTERIGLGAIKLSKGTNRFRVIAKGKNPTSSNYKFGLDCIELIPVLELSVAISTLKVLCGMTSNNFYNTDIYRDGFIGLQEVIFILKTIAEY